MIRRIAWLVLSSAFLLLLLSLPALAASTQSVRDLGAAGDGNTLDTKPIQAAIDACAQTGGGVVVFPPGRYLSGSLELKSHVHLVLEAGATLLGSKSLDDYRSLPSPAGMPEGKFRNADRWHRALLIGSGLEDVALLGPGTIDGNKVFDAQGEEHQRGPHIMVLGDTRGLRLHDVTFVDASNYGVFLEQCSDVQVESCTFRGGWDGVHFRGQPGHPCQDVTITNCRFFTGDDAIAGRYWERTLITGCTINSSCNGIRLIGPAQALKVHDCLFYGPGLEPHRSSGRTNMLAAICLQPGGWDRTEGRLDDVWLTDLAIRNVTTPFHFMMRPGNTAGSILVERTSASDVYYTAASVESWAEAPFERVIFRDVTVEYRGGGQVDAKYGPGDVRSPGSDARPLPAWGFYAHKVGELIFDNVHLIASQPDPRHAVIAHDVGRLDSASLQLTPQPEGGQPALLVDSPRDVAPTTSPSP